MKENGNNVKSTAQTAKREIKNSVFIDLFNIPKYQLMLFQTLHPEMTDVTVEDIQPVTINPVLVNMIYNDLGLLVRDRLLIFIEAQSTWSINILVRILMYLAATYQDYITEHQMNVYGSNQLDLPKPEFYVVYTGGRKFSKEIFSLREDFFHDPELPVDLVARVIHSENKEDIIGQYILFCHVIDEQVRQYGRTRQAVENAIRICSDQGILKEYLNGRKREVIDVMITLFDQGYAVEAYARELAAEAAKEAKKEGRAEGRQQGREEGRQQGREEGLQQGREEGIRVTVEMCQEIGMDVSGTIDKLSSKYGITRDKAAEYVEKYRNKTD